jgi:hypothetical protein
MNIRPIVATTEFERTEIDPRSCIAFQLGADHNTKEHIIKVTLETGPDGTNGIRVQGSHGQLVIQPTNHGELYITTHRPNKVHKVRLP